VADFFAIEIIKTFNDEGVLFRRQPSDSVENLRVNQNNVRRRNIRASNGVTHIIDGVLAPDWVSNSILAKVANADDLSILFELIEIAELTEALDIFGQELTLFAPTNDAFNALGITNLQSLSSPENKEALITILWYHVLYGVLTTDELDELDGGSLFSHGGVVVISAEAELGGITRKINQAKVLSDDSILTNNGVFYKIDAVLNPNSVDGF
jgi:transforming growth factor-beta-induced protein